MTAAAEMIRTYPADLGGVDRDVPLSRHTGYDANITGSTRM